MDSEAEKTTTTTTDAPPEKKYQVVFEEPTEAKPTEAKSATTEAKPADKKDTDAVRSGLTNAAPALFGFLKRTPKEDKSKDEPKPVKADKADKAADKPKEDEPKDQPTPDDLRAEKILGKKQAKPAAIPAPAPEPERMSAAEIAEVAARTVLSVNKQSAKVDAVIEYPKEYQENAAVFDHLAKSNPTKYGNIRADLSAFAEKEAEYRRIWESQNEGETFDPEADDHAVFYSKNTPNIDERDLDVAEKALEEEKISRIVESRVNERVAQQVAPLVAKQVEDQLRPAVIQQGQRFARAAISAVFPDIDLDKLTPEQLAEIEDKSPRQADIVNQAAARASQVGEAYLKITSQLTKLDVNNPVHADVVDTVSRVQSFILSRPRDERVRVDARGNTQEFIPIEQFVNLPKSKQEKYWTVGTEEVARQLEIDASSIAAKTWESEKRVLEKYGVKFENPKPKDDSTVRNTTPATPATKTTQTPDPVKVNVSRGMSERGGAGMGSSVVTLNPSSGFAALMKSLRPNRVRQT
jgi:hypothetical protein